MILKARGTSRTKREVANARLEAASLRSKAQADALGCKYPMPWTTEEAKANQDKLADLTGHKLVLLSRIASVADATRRRYRTLSSQRTEVQLECPSHCGFSAIISFRLHGE